MRAVKIAFLFVVAGMVAVGSSYAFHSGGVAECGGCHSMHSPNPNGTFLLVASDKSSACLSCHEHAGDTGPSSYHVSTADVDQPAGVAPKQRGPAGDFGWIRKDYTFTVRGTVTTEDGDGRGHNVVAVDNGYYVDTHNATAPGGTFPSAQLGCESCHDPHGRYRRDVDGNYATTGLPISNSGSYHNSADPTATTAVGSYRLLVGQGYVKGGVTFSTDPPMAVTPTPYNRTEAVSQTRVAYGQGMDEWCATCHGDMHSSGNYVHPTGETLGSTVIDIYNLYVKTGDMSGSSLTSYNSLVPFAEGTGATWAGLKTNANPTTVTTGPGNMAEVDCLSCHRAHASGFENALRWNMEGEFITVNGAYPSNATHPQFARGKTVEEITAAYYDRPATVFANYQRVLCNKCHAKD